MIYSAQVWWGRCQDMGRRASQVNESMKWLRWEKKSKVTLIPRQWWQVSASWMLFVIRRARCFQDGTKHNNSTIQLDGESIAGKRSRTCHHCLMRSWTAALSLWLQQPVIITTAIRDNNSHGLNKQKAGWMVCTATTSLCRSTNDIKSRQPRAVSPALQ